MENKIEVKKENRGGRRAGAGRPRGVNTTSMHLKLRNELVDFINSKPNKNKFINDCIEQVMKMEMGN